MAVPRHSLIAEGERALGLLPPEAGDECERRGEVNGYICQRCGEVTMVVLVDDGTTPFMIACRAEGLDPTAAKCKGTAESMFYPRSPLPPGYRAILLERGWEWYAASKGQLRRFRKRNPGLYDHCSKGGLLLRRLTDDGRAALPPEGE